MPHALLLLLALACADEAPVPLADDLVFTDAEGLDVPLSDFAGDVVGVELSWLH